MVGGIVLSGYVVDDFFSSSSFLQVRPVLHPVFAKRLHSSLSCIRIVSVNNLNKQFRIAVGKKQMITVKDAGKKSSPKYR